jgi:hypothetical protein
MESIPGLHKRLKAWAQATKAGRIDFLESIPGLLKNLKIRALAKVDIGEREWPPLINL